MTPKAVIIETPDAFQLVLLLHCVLCLVRHLLDYHKRVCPAVRIPVPHAGHFAEPSLWDALAMYLLVLALAILPWLIVYVPAPQYLPYQGLRHGKLDRSGGGW